MAANPSGDAFKGVARDLTNQERADIAFFRFGLGPKRGNTRALAGSPNAARDACLAELVSPNLALLPARPGFSTAECCRLGRKLFESGRVRYEELSFRFAKHMQPSVGFVERLVLFWANHFSLNQNKSPQVRAVIGDFERNVIRRNVLGSYAQMLKDAVQHPALIQYLDNQRSQPNAPNENLAREILELYTVGTSSGYGQSDVRALAQMLVGWTVEEIDRARVGQFKFDTSASRLGTFQLMGQTYSGPAREQAIKALDWLARHGSTARHLATKLLRHFGWDAPAADEITKLAAIIGDKDKTLKDVAAALIENEALWVAPYRIRPPHLWVVSQARALGFGLADFRSEGEFTQSMTMSMTARPAQARVEGQWLSRLALLNNAPWGRVTPDGYPDESSEWVYPSAMRIRISVVRQILLDAEGRGTLPDAAVLFQEMFPGSAEAAALQNAHPNLKKQALARLFLTTKFMLR